MAIDSKFLKHIEKMFPGRDIQAHNDEKLHNHGSSTIKYGRGAVLTVDLTNRCNMMCDPCFMDANQVGFVHELSFDDVKDILDKAISIKPRRQMSVQFSGGEPTISPILPRLGPLRAQGRLQLGAGRDERHRVRQVEGVRQGGRRGGPALRLPPVRRHRQRRQLAPSGRQPLRREVARHRQPARGGRRDRARHHAGQQHQQRSGRLGHPLRARQSEEDRVPLVPARLVYGARRGDHGRAPHGAALHPVAPRARRERAGRHHRADARLVPALA